MIGDTEQSYGITYKDISGLLDSYTTPQNSFDYSYDNFDRLTRKLGDRHSIQYTYVNGSQRVLTYTISQADASSVTYTYTYDNLGNITSVKKNGTTVSVYEYDSLGRLVRENDCANSTAWVYTYDNAGNLLKKYTFYGVANTVPAVHLLSIHPYNGSEISATYTYSSSAWGDLLANYNGTAITYDQIGNPLNWRNASSLTWEKRSLQSMTLSNGTMLSFEYNASGIRTKKTVGTTVHDYILDGSTILKETITSGSTTTTLYYYYDESGISGISYNGTKYSYIRNLQGDVIGIINSNGVTVVEYKYDAWGNILSTTGSLASTLGATNPFRYRGYYYDTETGFYYLQSRYYDPQVGRFLNADGIIGANGGIMGYNMFAYCSNNPVMYVDPNGEKCYVIHGPQCPTDENGDCLLHEGDCCVPDIRQILLQRLSIKFGINLQNIKNNPPDHPDFHPPKRGNEKVKNPNGKGNGWLDKDGGVWIWDPNMHGGKGWVIQYPGGRHKHAYPGGHVREYYKVESHPPVITAAKFLVGVILTGVLVIDDCTGVGMVDNTLIPVATSCIFAGVNDFSLKETCTICGEVFYG